MESYQCSRLAWKYFLLLIPFFLFVHKFHLLGHRILVAKKENTILPLMKKLINIHLSGNVMGSELCMSMYSGGQARRLCMQSG